MTSCSLSLSSVLLDGLGKVIFKYLSNCCLERVWPGSELIIYVVCFQLMSFRNRRCGKLKREHLEFSSLATKNIISLLTQCLWPPNLAGWWLIMRGSCPYNHDLLIMWSCKITWQTKFIIFPLPDWLRAPNLAGW